MFWALLKPKKEPVVRKSDVESYCDQMANHVREVLRNKILMDDATKRACEINRTTPYECKDYVHAVENNNIAHVDFNNRMTIWSHHISILGMLILPLVSVIVDVDGVKYKVTNKASEIGFHIDIEEIK